MTCVMRGGIIIDYARGGVREGMSIGDAKWDIVRGKMGGGIVIGYARGEERDGMSIGDAEWNIVRGKGKRPFWA